MVSFTISTPKGLRTIGPGHPTFIIAELSCNHHHQYEQAVKLVDAAAAAGADAVKLQTYTPDTLTIDCDSELFQIKVNEMWMGQTLYQLYQKAYTPWEWQPKLKEHAEKRGIVLFSSPFDLTSVDFLEKMQVPLYKVASLEINYVQLLHRIGKTGKPVIISRGLAPLQEIQEAVDTLKASGCPSVAILHCISSYPALPEQMNLRTIPDLMIRFPCIAGLSDHCLGSTVPITAVALGASIIEKHLILSRSEGGPDSAFSLEPQEFQSMVEAVRECEKTMGNPTYEIGKKEGENLVFKRSIMVVEDVKQGEQFTEKNLRVIRPGFGLAPKELSNLIGKRASRDIARGSAMRWELVAKEEHAVRS